MAFKYPTLTLILTLLLLLTPLTLSHPTTSTTNTSIATAVERTNALLERNTTDLNARQQNDASGQIMCTPTNDLHKCLLRSTQFPDKEAVLTVYDPWCNTMGVRVDKVQTIPDQYLAINIIAWAQTVEVTWWLPFWWYSPEGWYNGWQFGEYGTIDQNTATGCQNCDRISWLVPFRC